MNYELCVNILFDLAQFKVVRLNNYILEALIEFYFMYIFIKSSAFYNMKFLKKLYWTATQSLSAFWHLVKMVRMWAHTRTIILFSFLTNKFLACYEKSNLSLVDFKTSYITQQLRPSPSVFIQTQIRDHADTHFCCSYWTALVHKEWTIPVLLLRCAADR